MTSISTSLLVRLQAKDRDEEAWGRLLELFGPMVYARCRRAGVPPQDAADVGQEVFVEVARSIAAFRRDQPGHTFRGWLARVTEYRVADYWRRRYRIPEGEAAGGSEARERLAEVTDAVTRIEDDSTATESEEADGLRRRALELVAARFEPRTWRACYLVVMEGQPAEAVAAELGMTLNAVRVAKSRVLACLREEFENLLDVGAGPGEPDLADE